MFLPGAVAIQKWNFPLFFGHKRDAGMGLLVFCLVYVQHENIIAIGWQQPREQKHVGCHFAPISPIDWDAGR